MKTKSMQDTFDTTLEYAQRAHREDKLQSFRSRFYFPLAPGASDGTAIYFCGNSLGLQPRDVTPAILQELKDWQDLAIGGFTQARDPWLTCQEPLRAPLARIVGAHEDEVTV